MSKKLLYTDQLRDNMKFVYPSKLGQKANFAYKELYAMPCPSMNGEILYAKQFEKPSKEVSERMKRVKSSDTSLEKAMEELLKCLQIRYEKQPDLLGHPDFRIKETNVLIFCDSSFWHGRRETEITGKAFKVNREFWTKKLIENRKRDQRINRALRKSGWSVQRFWDTDILKRQDKVKNRLRRIINDKSG